MLKHFSSFSVLVGVIVVLLVFQNSQFNVFNNYISNLPKSSESIVMKDPSDLSDVGVDDVCAIEASRIAKNDNVLSNEKVTIDPNLSLRCLKGYDGPLLPHSKGTAIDTLKKVYDQISEEPKKNGGAFSTKFDEAFSRAYAYHDSSQCISSCEQIEFKQYKSKYESEDFLSKCPETLSNKPTWKSNPEFKNVIGSDEAFFVTRRNRIESPCCYDRTPLTLCDYTFRGGGGMMDSDRLLLGKYYYYAESIFETGIGESTKIASFTNVPRYTGFDSDSIWVSEARDGAPQRYRFGFGDIGGTIAWGTPKDKSLRKIVLNYQMTPLQSELKPFDIYLVDGRYRVSNVFVCFLHAMKTGGDMEHVRVMMHDYWDRRHKYGVPEKIADIVDRSERLAVYKLKPDVSEDAVFKLWEENMLNSD